MPGGRSRRKSRTLLSTVLLKGAPTLRPPFAGALHCAVGSQCIAIREHPAMGKIEINPDDYEALIVKLTDALDTAKAANGKRVDRVEELCALVDISKRDLAAALVFRSNGKITFVELARRLSVNESTIRRWPEIHRALKAK